jgi:hypothetical protein
MRDAVGEFRRHLIQWPAGEISPVAPAESPCSVVATVSVWFGWIAGMIGGTQLQV